MKKIDKNIDSYKLYVENILSKSEHKNTTSVQHNNTSVQHNNTSVQLPSDNLIVTKKYYREEYANQNYNNITMQYLNLSYKDYSNKVLSGFGPY
jgi:ketopantoate reductase